MPIVIRGVHPFPSEEPCHLIEVEILDAVAEVDWGAFTQEVASIPRENWQVAYDEEPIDGNEKRWSFFFHYLDFSKPLLSPEGPVTLPAPTPLPGHLKDREYGPP